MAAISYGDNPLTGVREHYLRAGRCRLTGFGEMAFRMAGVGPEDMDFAELYDCFSIVPACVRCQMRVSAW